MGIRLPAATQWELVEEAAVLIKPARDELIRQAAEGEVVCHQVGQPAGKVLRSFESALDECLVDHYLGGDIRQFVLLPDFHLLSHGLEVALHATPHQPKCSRGARTTSSILPKSV